MHSQRTGRTGGVWHARLLKFSTIGCMMLVCTFLLNAPLLAFLPGQSLAAHGSNPIKHIVFFIKENRTFDNYFGTYPGADGAEELGLPTLTARDRGANNMMGACDFSQQPRPPLVLKQRQCKVATPITSMTYDD